MRPVNLPEDEFRYLTEEVYNFSPIEASNIIQLRIDRGFCHSANYLEAVRDLEVQISDEIKKSYPRPARVVAKRLKSGYYKVRRLRWYERLWGWALYEPN